MFPQTAAGYQESVTAPRAAILGCEVLDHHHNPEVHVSRDGAHIVAVCVRVSLCECVCVCASARKFVSVYAYM